jgi:hypothetical protein
MGEHEHGGGEHHGFHGNPVVTGLSIVDYAHLIGEGAVSGGLSAGNAGAHLATETGEIFEGVGHATAAQRGCSVRRRSRRRSQSEAESSRWSTASARWPMANTEKDSRQPLRELPLQDRLRKRERQRAWMVSGRVGQTSKRLRMGSG